MSAKSAVRALSGIVLAFCLLPSQAAEPEPTYSVRTLTPETSLKAAQAAIKKCRDSGYQVAVALVDRSGLTQVVLRDRYAGAHTPDTAAGKAWTAVSFRASTGEMARETQAGKAASGIRHLPRVVMVGGGMLIEGGGTILGGIGVSGAPGGELDETCAKAGIEAIRDALEF